MIQEFADGLVTAANLDLYTATLRLDVDELRAKQVDALALADELDFDLPLVRVVIHVLGKRDIDSIGLDRDVDSEPCLQVGDVRLERVHFHLVIFIKLLDRVLHQLIKISELLDQVQASLVRLETSVL